MREIFATFVIVIMIVSALSPINRQQHINEQFLCSSSALHRKIVFRMPVPVAKRLADGKLK